MTVEETTQQANAQTGLDVDDQQVVTAAQMQMVRCHYCGTVWKDAPEEAACGICHARLHFRKPDSLSRTWALLIAACILYIPANLFPVMVTTTFMGKSEDTILSGIIYFWVTGSWHLAVIVFIASFLVPLFKLVSLLLLVWLAQTGSTWRRKERAKLYRIVEFIGRWSMLDVFVVALLAGLVQMEGLATIRAGIGVAAFGAVVVLTMLASISFDPRLTWDKVSGK